MKAKCKLFTLCPQWSGLAPPVWSQSHFPPTLYMLPLLYAKWEHSSTRWLILSHHSGLSSNFWAFCQTLAASHSTIHHEIHPFLHRTILSSSEHWSIQKSSYLLDIFSLLKWKFLEGPGTWSSLYPRSLDGCLMVFVGWLTHRLRMSDFKSYIKIYLSTESFKSSFFDC